MFDSNSESFDGISIFRPSIKAEILARNYVETTLRAKYPPGEYTQDDKLGEIIQYIASISDNSVRDIIQQIASRSLLFFCSINMIYPR